MRIATFFIMSVIVLNLICGMNVSNIKSADLSTKAFLENQTIIGSVNLAHKRYNKLSIKGTATLDDVIIINTLTIHGSLYATYLTAPIVKVNGTCTVNHSRANYIVVSGSAHIDHTVVDNEMKVLDMLTASNSTFSNIIGNGKKIVITNCRVNGNIIVTHKENPVIELHDTIIKGKVVFVASEGMVFASGGNRPACQNGLVAWEPTR